MNVGLPLLARCNLVRASCVLMHHIRSACVVLNVCYVQIPKFPNSQGVSYAYITNDAPLSYAAIFMEMIVIQRLLHLSERDPRQSGHV